MYSLKNITVEDIRLKVKANDWKEAIIKSSEVFLERGYINQNYVNRMIESVLEFGPYIVLAENIALAHARPEDGALKTGLYFATLEKPINFGSEDYDPVKLMIVLSAKDSKGHIGLLTELGEILGNKELVNSLIDSNSEKEFLELITGEIK